MASTPTKQYLITTLAGRAQTTPAIVRKVLDAITATAHESVYKGDTVLLPGIGKLVVKERAARVSRNPSTGAPIKVKAAKVVRFRPSTSLRETAAKIRKPEKPAKVAKPAAKKAVKAVKPAVKTVAKKTAKAKK